MSVQGMLAESAHVCAGHVVEFCAGTIMLFIDKSVKMLYPHTFRIAQVSKDLLHTHVSYHTPRNWHT